MRCGGCGKKGGRPYALGSLKRMLTTALNKKQAMWPALQIAWEWVHQVASILENHDHLNGTGVQEQLQAQLSMMQDHQDQVAALGDVVERFTKVTANYAPGLSYPHDTPSLPPPPTASAHRFASVRS